MVALLFSERFHAIENNSLVAQSNSALYQELLLSHN